MLDLAAAVFASKPTVGLLMAEDPHLVGWNENREIAENLAVKMGISTPLPDFFDFPLGTMFWCRPAALTARPCQPGIRTLWRCEQAKAPQR